MSRFRGVILDIDGTLVDSNDAHAHAWVEALAEHGYSVPFEEVRPLIGMGGDKVMPKLIGVEKESEEGERISERRSEIFKARYLPKLEAFPKSRDLLLRMRERGLRLVVASSAEEGELESLLDVAQIGDLIESKTSSSDAESSKPDPDIVQAALDELDMPAHEVVMLGDTAYDIDAARDSGIDVIALRCGGWQDKDFSGALAIYDDPADLLAQFEASPLAKGASHPA